MKGFHKLLSIGTVILLLAVFFLLPNWALACPTCGVEGLSDNQARGFYLSYLLLLVAPFALVALVGSQVLRAYNSGAFEKVMGWLRTSRQAIWIYLSVGLAVGVLAFYAAASQSRTQSFPLPRQLLIGRADIGGRGPILQETLEGKVVLVNFWASWCFPACWNEAPRLEAAWEKYKDRGVMIVGIVYQDSEENARAFIRRFGKTYPNGLDRRSRIAIEYGVYGVPETFFIDKQGKIAHKHTGELTDEVITKKIEELL